MAQIQFTSTGQKGFTPLPTGTYDVQIESVEESVSKSQKEQLVVKGHVVGGDKDGRSVTVYYSKLPQSGWKIEALLKASGIDYEGTGGEDDPFLFDSDALVDTYVRYDIVESEWDGRPKNDYKNERTSPLASAAPAAVALPTAAAMAEAAPRQRRTVNGRQ